MTATALLRAALCLSRRRRAIVLHTSCTVNPALPGRIGRSLSIYYTADMYIHNTLNIDQQHRMFGCVVGSEWFWHSYACFCWQISGKNLESSMIACISTSCHVHTLNCIFFSSLTPVRIYSGGEIQSIKPQPLITLHKTCKGILMFNLRWNLELHYVRRVHACLQLLLPLFAPFNSILATLPPWRSVIWINWIPQILKCWLQAFQRLGVLPWHSIAEGVGKRALCTAHHRALNIQGPASLLET